MRYAQGDGYELMLVNVNESAHFVAGPGLLIVLSGHVRVGDHVVQHGSGAEFDEPVWIHKIFGSFALAIETLDSPLETVIGSSVRVEPVIRHDKPWGYENEVQTTRKTIQLKELYVGEGHSTSKQYHEHKDEVILFMDGPPEPWLIPPKKVHRVIGTAGPRHYVEASTYFPDDVVRLADQYGRMNG